MTGQEDYSTKDLLKRIERLEERSDKLEENNRQLRKKLNNALTGKEAKENQDQLSRRSFLKKVGAGAAGLGAVGIASASGLKLTADGVSSASGLEFLDSGSQYFNINSGGPVQIKNTKMEVLGTDASDNSLRLDGHIDFTGANANGSPVLRTPGGGSDSIRLFDEANSQNLMKWNEGGPVEVKNADLNVSGTVDIKSDGGRVGRVQRGYAGHEMYVLKENDGGETVNLSNRTLVQNGLMAFGVVLKDRNPKAAATFMMDGSNTVTKLNDPENILGTSSNANQVNVYHNGSDFILQGNDAYQELSLHLLTS